MFRQKVKISSLFTDELFTAKVCFINPRFRDKRCFFECSSTKQKWYLKTLDLPSILGDNNEPFSSTALFLFSVLSSITPSRDTDSNDKYITGLAGTKKILYYS